MNNQPKKNETHVLIVGIDAYDSPNLPALQGARNDAVAWYRFCVNHLRIDPKNITVLASPRLTPAELGPQAGVSRLKGATRVEILDEARRLADVAVNSAGLLTFSGHGLAVGADPGGAVGPDLAVCPSDTRVELPASGDASISGTLRFSDLAAIFASQDCKDNITAVIDTCYSDGPSAAMRGPLETGKRLGKVDALKRARQIRRVEAFTNRFFLGARHWTTAYEIKVGGAWRGAASYAMQTLMERWALRQEDGILYPNASHGDLLEATRDFLEVLGVPQHPALWGQRRLEEMPVLRPGLRFSPGETSPRPNAPTNERQCPVEPDKIALIEFKSQTDDPILRVIAVGASLPSGVTGYNTRTEYWYTNTSSPPSLSGLTMTYTTTTSQSVADNFKSGYTLSITCEQLIGQQNWSTWSSTVNTTGTLFQADDPTGNERYMGLYLQYNTNGTLATYAWYRMTLLEDGFAFEEGEPPEELTALEGTDPNEMEEGTWEYSLVVSPP